MLSAAQQEERQATPAGPVPDTGRSAADQRELRARRIAAAEKILAQHPDTGPRELARLPAEVA